MWLFKVILTIRVGRTLPQSRVLKRTRLFLWIVQQPFLLICKALSVPVSQIKSVEGFGQSNPVADNSTKAGQAQNRRVEVYMYASQKMIQDAKARLVTNYAFSI